MLILIQLIDIRKLTDMQFIIYLFSLMQKKKNGNIILETISMTYLMSLSRVLPWKYAKIGKLSFFHFYPDMYFIIL